MGSPTTEYPVSLQLLKYNNGKGDIRKLFQRAMAMSKNTKNTTNSNRNSSIRSTACRKWHEWLRSEITDRGDQYHDVSVETYDVDLTNKANRTKSVSEKQGCLWWAPQRRRLSEPTFPNSSVAKINCGPYAEVVNTIKDFSFLLWNVPVLGPVFSAPG